MTLYCIQSVCIIRQITRIKSKSGAVVKHQMLFVVLKTTSNVKQLFKSGAAPLYHPLVISLHYVAYILGVIFFQVNSTTGAGTHQGSELQMKGFIITGDTLIRSSKSIYMYII